MGKKKKKSDLCISWLHNKVINVQNVMNRIFIPFKNFVYLVRRLPNTVITTTATQVVIVILKSYAVLAQ